MTTIEAKREGRLAVTTSPMRARPAVTPSNRDFDGGLKLQDLLAIIRRRWKLCLACSLATLLAAIAYYLLVPSTFESSAQLLVMRKDPQLAARGVGGARDADAGVSEDLLSTQMQLIQSRRIVTEALAENGLDQLVSITSVLDDGETTTDYVIDNLYVTRGGEGQASDADVLNVAFRHSSEIETQQIVEAIIDRYQLFLNETFQDVNREAAELIVSARSELSAELTAAEETYQKYREQAPILWNGDISTNVHRQRFDELQTELSQVGIQINEAAARLKIVQRVVEEQNVAGVSDFERLVVIDEKNAERVGILLAVQQGEAETAEFQSRQPERMENARSEYQSLLQLRMREKRLRQDFGPRHPEVESIQNQIAIAENFINSKGTNLGVGDSSMINPKDLQDAYVTLLSRDLETLRQRETELLAMAATEEQRAKELVKYEIEGEALRQRVSRQQELYDAVVDRLREINLAKDYGGVINEVIAEAEMGDEVWPSLPICLALGLLGGAVFSGAGTTVVEMRDRSFKAVDDISEALGAEVLVTIPLLRPSSDRRLGDAMRASNSTLASALYAHHLPQSPEAELFRVLRTSIFFRQDNTDLKSIMFTSPDAGDGKTTVLSNLAVSIAQTERRVLIIDADMRRPSIHTVFDLPHEDGLAQVLTGGRDPQEVIRPTSVADLQVMTCGSNVHNPAELLSAGSFSELIEAMRDQYDFVLVDCPPVLAVADPCIVAPRVDGLVLVLRMTNEARPKATRCKTVLEDAGAAVVGTVVNRWSAAGDARHADYGYGYTANPPSENGSRG